jgi:nucleoside-diphosphate-sugar epimerase
LTIPNRERHVLVVGGAGYIGSVLVRRLLDRGYRVRVLDALLYDNYSALGTVRGKPGFSFVHGDLCRASDVDTSMRAVTDVILLAALVGDPICREHPDLARRINQTGTLEFINRLAGRQLDRFLFMSTCSNYGLHESDAEATEESPLNPQSLYAETKVNVERYLLDHTREFDFGVTILRTATAYGISPRMRFDLTVNEFTRELALGRELVVYDADTWRPYCHIGDIAAALVAVMEADPASVKDQVLNVGADGENYTKRMIVDLLCYHIPDAHVRYQVGSVDPRNYRVSFRKIADCLGFSTELKIPAFLPHLIRAIRDGLYNDAESRPRFYRNFSPLALSP